jgi:hypothetical protein
MKQIVTNGFLECRFFSEIKDRQKSFREKTDSKKFKDHKIHFRVYSLKTLTNYVNPSVFKYVQDETSFGGSIKTLKDIFIKQENEIF